MGSSRTLPPLRVAVLLLLLPIILHPLLLNSSVLLIWLIALLQLLLLTMMRHKSATTCRLLLPVRGGGDPHHLPLGSHRIVILNHLLRVGATATIVPVINRRLYNLNVIIEALLLNLRPCQYIGLMIRGMIHYTTLVIHFRNMEHGHIRI